MKYNLKNLKEHWDILHRVYVFGDDKQFKKVAIEFGEYIKGFEAELREEYVVQEKCMRGAGLKESNSRMKFIKKLLGE